MKSRRKRSQLETHKQHKVDVKGKKPRGKGDGASGTQVKVKKVKNRLTNLNYGK